jgi:hypothetical protein
VCPAQTAVDGETNDGGGRTYAHKQRQGRTIAEQAHFSIRLYVRDFIAASGGDGLLVRPGAAPPQRRR